MLDAVDQHCVFYEGCGIMTAIREYLLSVTCAAILSSLITRFFSKKDGVSTIIRILCGMFVSLTVLQPVLNIQVPDVNMLYGFDDDFSQVAQEGILSAQQAQCAVIQQKSEEYIYDKAARLGCEIEIHITVSPDQPFQPIHAQIRGAVSPYAKQILINTIQDDLGIPAEEQQWI